MHHIDKIFYINLDYREDRKQRITSEFKRLGIPEDKITRFSAQPYKGCPISGCLVSHATILETAFDEGYNNVLILEDDFDFIADAEKVEKDIDAFFQMKIDWDVIMFTTCSREIMERTNSLISRISSSSNSAGYLANRSMMLELSTLLRANLENLFSTQQHWIYSNDTLWNRLMPSSNFFMFNHYLGYQCGGYSDLAKAEIKAIVPQVIESLTRESVVPQVVETITTESVAPQVVEPLTKDSIVNSVINSFVKRSNLGLQKYGTTLDRNDLGVLDWIQHAQEEHMDAILYLEKLKTELIKKPL